MFKVLRPIFQKTGETSRSPESREIRWERVKWLEVGYATSMEHAKEQFGGSPVLQEMAAAGSEH